MQMPKHFFSLEDKRVMLTKGITFKVGSKNNATDRSIQHRENVTIPYGTARNSWISDV